MVVSILVRRNQGHVTRVCTLISTDHAVSIKLLSDGILKKGTSPEHQVCIPNSEFILRHQGGSVKKPAGLNLQSQMSQLLSDGRASKGFEEASDRWFVGAVVEDDEVVFFVLIGMKAQIQVFGHRMDGHAPIGQGLSDGDGDGVVGLCFGEEAGRLVVAQDLIEQHAGAAAAVAVDHTDSRIGDDPGQGTVEILSRSN
jgi:hypothetical protein